MTSPLAAVLEIAGVGSVLLFLALAGLIGLMYALTAVRLAGTSAAAADEVDDAGADAEPSTAVAAQAQAAAEAEAEQERRQRAVVLAVAVARARLTAQAARRADRPAAHTPPEWRSIHRVRRLSTPTARARRRA